MAIYEHPFSCTRCEEHAPEEFVHFAPTDTWVIRYLDEQLIHIHFGSATSNDDESTAETTFVYDNIIPYVEKGSAEKLFCTVIDVSRADDSELPSDETVELYKKMLSHERNGLTIFYGMTPSMNFFVGMLKHLIKNGDRIQVRNTAEEAEAEYQRWIHDNQ